MSSIPNRPPALAEGLAAGEPDLVLAVSGGSMRPLLRHGDLIAVRRLAADSLRPGDLAVLLRWHGLRPEYVVHRYLGWSVTKGDANLLPDAPFDPRSVVGVVVAAKAAGRWRAAGGRLGGLVLSAAGPLLRALPLQPVCAAWALAENAAEPNAAPPPFVAPAVVDADQTWSGAVEVRGDLTIPRGVTLTLAPGAKLVFRPEAQSAGRLLVSGALAARQAGLGDGGAWGGIHLLAGASAILHDTTLEGCPEAAVVLQNGAAAVLSGCALTGCGVGVSLEGGRAELRGVTMKVCARFGAWNRGGALRLEDCRFEDCGDAAVLVEAGGSLSARRCRTLGGRSGLALRGGRASLRSFRVADASHCGVAADGGLDLDEVEVETCPIGVSFGSGKLTARSLSIKNCPTAVLQRGGDLTWSGGGAAGGKEGFTLTFGAAKLSRLRFDAFSSAALRAEGGTLNAESVETLSCLRSLELSSARASVRRLRGGDLLLRSGARLDLSASRAGTLEASASEVRAERSYFREVLLRSGSRLRLAKSELSSLGADASEADVERCAFKSAADAVEARRSTVRLRRCVLTPARAAVRAEDCVLELAESTLRGGEAGLAAKGGRSVLKRSDLSGQSGPAALQEGGTLELERCRLDDNGGVRVQGGRLTLSRCRLSGQKGAAVQVSGAADLRELEVSGADCGLRVEGGEASLAAVSFHRCGLGVDLPQGSLAWRGGTLSKCAEGLRCAGDASLEGVDFDEAGAAVDGGRLSASGCSWKAVQAAVRLSGDGEVSLSACSMRSALLGFAAASGQSRLSGLDIEGARLGLALDGGRHALSTVTFKDCLQDRAVDPGAEISLEPARPSPASAAQLLVMRTRAWPPLSAAYRAFYRLPVLLLRLLSFFDGNLAWLGLHRSWAAGEWEPGTSDIDLLARAKDLSGERGLQWLKRSAARLARLKRLFPFVGEVLAFEESDASAYARWGGLRARGFAEQLVSLRGEAPRRTLRPDSAKSVLEPLGEAAHAFTRLMASTLASPDSPLAASKARKAALDLLRAGAAGADGALVPRRDALDAAGAAAGPFRAPLEELRRAERDCADSPQARMRLCAAAVVRMHELSVPGLHLADSFTSAVASVAPVPAAGDEAVRELARRRRLRALLERTAGGLLIGGSCDDLYRSCLVLSDEAVRNPEALGGVLRSLAALREARGEPGTLPLVMTLSTWTIWSRLPYLESPLRWLEAETAASHDALYRASPGGWLYCWNLPASAPFPAELLRDLGKESLASLRLSWRWQSSAASGLSEEYARHYLLSRVMGLRLLAEAGIAAPSFDLEALRRAYAERFGAVDAGMDRRALHLWADATLRLIPL